MSMVINLVEDHNIYLCEGGPVYNGGVQPTPITYLTQWKIVGNSEVHTLPYPDGVVLPTAYKRCKYLEFHGTEWFNSGIIPEQGIGVSMTFKYLGEYQGEVRDDGIFGCRVSAYSADSLYCFRQAQTDKLFVSYGGKICDYTTTGNFLINAGDEIELHLDSNSLSFTNGTNTFTQSHNYQITKGTNTLNIGRINGYGYLSRILLRTFILTNSVGDTIFNGIPCLDANDVPCLYDTVSETAFYNQGTGTLGYELYPQPTEIWSCGEYSEIDNKYHIVILPQGKSPVDIALNEPLRKVNDVADTIEFPSDTEGKALVTRYFVNYQIKDFEYSQRSDTTNCHRIRTLNTLDTINYDSTVLSNTLTVNFINKTLNDANNASEGYYVASYNQYLMFYVPKSVSQSDFETTYGEDEILVELATPTTELVDAPQIVEAESYSCVISQGAKAVEWSSFETE